MTKTVNKPATVATFTVKGAGAAKRMAAYGNISQLAFVESMSRADSIANLQAALGKAPSDGEVTEARNRWIIGRVASRMPGKAATDAKLASAATIVNLKAAPPKPGTAARPLRAGQIGRRTPDEQKLVQSATEAWSQVKAELGLGAAATQGQRNAAKAKTVAKAKELAKRAAHHNDKDGAQTAPAKPDASTLPPTGKMTADDVASYLNQQSSTLDAFARKHAKAMPIEYSAAITALAAFRSATIAAANAYQVAKAAKK
jgi:hypothetical protein